MVLLPHEHTHTKTFNFTPNTHPYTHQVIMKLIEMMDSTSDIVSALLRKLAPPMVTLLSADQEIQYVALRNINLIVQKRCLGRFLGVCGVYGVMRGLGVYGGKRWGFWVFCEILMGVRIFRVFRKEVWVWFLLGV